MQATQTDKIEATPQATVFNSSASQERFRIIDGGRLDNDPVSSLTPKQLFQRCVWASDETAHTKIMLLCISRFFDKSARSSSMSYQQIARDCAMNESTSKRIAQAVLGKWLEVKKGKGFYTPGRGYQNLYHGICPPSVVDKVRQQMLGVAGKDPDTASGVAQEDPADEVGVAGRDAERGRGLPECSPGSHKETRTVDNLDVSTKDKSEREPASLIIADNTHRTDFDEQSPIFEGIPAIVRAAERWQHAKDGREAAERTAHFKRGLAGVLQTNPPAVVLAALNSTILELEATDPSTKSFSSFSRLFWKVLNSAIDVNFKREVGKRTEVAIAEKRIGAMEARIAQGQAGRTKTLPPPDDGRFDPDQKGIIKVAGHLLSGADLNLILDQVDGATRDQAKKACIDISDTFKPRPGESIAIKTVIDKATTKLRKTLLFQKYGTPKEQAGGGEICFHSDWFYLSKTKAQEFSAEFPCAFRDGEASDFESFYLRSAIQGILSECEPLHARYGIDLQQHVESQVRAQFAEDQKAREWEQKKRIEEEARRAQREQQETKRKELWEVARYEARKDFGKSEGEFRALGQRGWDLVDAKFKLLCAEHGIPFAQDKDSPKSIDDLRAAAAQIAKEMRRRSGEVYSH